MVKGVQNPFIEGVNGKRDSSIQHLIVGYVIVFGQICRTANFLGYMLKNVNKSLF